MAMNKAILIGRLTKNIELKYTQSGKAVTNFTVAVNRKYSKDETDFITVVAWEKKAEFASQYFRKGDPIQVIGRIETRSYQDKNGNDRTAVEVVVDEVDFVEGYKRSESRPSAPVERQSGSAPLEYEDIVDDDDLPFQVTA